MVKILIDATLSGIPLTESFCLNDYIAKMFTKVICNISSGRVGNTADFEISISNLTHKLLPNTSFEKQKIA